MSGERAVKFHEFSHFPQRLMCSVGEAQFDSSSLQQHHFAVVCGEIRERTRRVDMRHTHPPAEWIAAGRHPYRFMGDAAAILPRRRREGSLADDLQFGILHSSIL